MWYAIIYDQLGKNVHGTKRRFKYVLNISYVFNAISPAGQIVTHKLIFKDSIYKFYIKNIEYEQNI